MTDEQTSPALTTADRALGFRNAILGLARAMSDGGGLTVAEGTLGAVSFAADAVAGAMPRDQFLAMCGEFYDLALAETTARRAES